MEITFTNSVIVGTLMVIMNLVVMSIIKLNNGIYENWFGFTTKKRILTLIVFIIIGGVGCAATIFLPIGWFEKLPREWFEWFAWLPTQLKDFLRIFTIYPSEYDFNNNLYEVLIIAISRFIVGAVSMGIIFGFLFFFLFGTVGLGVTALAMGSIFHILISIKETL